MVHPPNRARLLEGATVTFDTVPEITDVAVLFAVAIAIEREAARRYGELAARAAAAGESELADLFARLRDEEADHENGIGAWAVREGIMPATTLAFHWDSPAVAMEEEVAEAGGSRMGTWKALVIAVHNEERAFAFYINVAAKTPDADVRRYAERMAEEELEHVALLRMERRRAWQGEHAANAAALPAAGAPDATDADALAEYVAEVEGESARRLRAEAGYAKEAGAARTASLLEAIAAEAEERSHGREIGTVRPDLPHVSADALQLVRDEERRLSRLYEGYIRLIDTARDERLLRRAQEETEVVLSRLARLRDEEARLRSTASADSPVVS